MSEAGSSGNELPKPTKNAKEQSEKLQTIIVDEINKHSGISFARFMQYALYHPGLGYYQSAANPFGQSGDFITATEISPIFAACLAHQCQQIFSELKQARILEFGAGSGQLAADLLTALNELQCLPDQYLIMEFNPYLRALQQQTLARLAPDLADRVKWLDQLPGSFNGVIIANEVLDAMPAHVISLTPQGPRERFVTWENQFLWQDKDISHPRLQQCIEQIFTPQQHCDNYLTEINLAAQDWLSTVAEVLQQGVMLLIDYGFPRQEYYHPQRDQGTLMCHYRHRAHTDPFILVGLQDITTHVDFTAIAQAGMDVELDLAGYTTQAYFLIANGMEEIAEIDSPADQKDLISQAQAIKKLTLPSEMGELFKVMAFSRRMDLDLNGFKLYDHSHKLGV